MKLQTTPTPDRSSLLNAADKIVSTPTRSSTVDPARHRPESRDVHFTPYSILASPSDEESSHRVGPPLSQLICHRRQEDLGDQLKIVYRQFCEASDVLELVALDGAPSLPSRNHVVIKVEASTISLEDCITRRGFDFDLFNPISLPQTPGMDVVGYVVKSADRSWSVGDRVAALIRTGGNARFACAPTSGLVRVPANIDAADAVAMVSNYTTAYQALKRIKQEGPMFSMLNKKVLIIGGMDGVGQALIQMCSKARAIIYATGPVHRHTYIQNILGAHGLPETNWLSPQIQGTMDYVFDGFCDGLETSYKALKPKTGELVCFGRTSMLREKTMGILGAPLSAHFHKLWSQTFPTAIHINIWESYNNDPATYKKNLKSLMHLLKWNKIKPNIAKRVGLDGVAIAQTKLENGELRGTVVCLPWKV